MKTYRKKELKFVNMLTNKKDHFSYYFLLRDNWFLKAKILMNYIYECNVLITKCVTRKKQKVGG